MIDHQPSPIQSIILHGVQVFIKRDDLLSSVCSGNKFRKLKYNLLEAKKLGYRQLISFGGAFSNHLYALAIAGKNLDFETIGIIRGEEDLLNPNCKFLRNCGMQLNFVSRDEYRCRSDPDYIEQLANRYPDAYIIPEGGSNQLACKGIAEMIMEVRDKKLEIGHWFCAIGSGGTAAGVCQSISENSKLHAVSVLKHIDPAATIRQHLDSSELRKLEIVNVEFGARKGFAKLDLKIIECIKRVWKDYRLPLEPIYTAKVFLVMEQMIIDGRLMADDRVLFYHSGGLQGLMGINYRFKHVLSNIDLDQNNPATTLG